MTEELQDQIQPDDTTETANLIQQLKEAKAKIQELEKKNRGLYAKAENSKSGFSAKFLTGRRRLVTFRYGKEIAAYLHIKYVAMQRARENATTGVYPFLYRTNAKILMKQLGVTYEAATKVIKFLNDTGAWRLVKTEPGKIYIYQIGERKRVNFPAANGKRTLGYKNKFYFSLATNGKSWSFYKREISQLLEIEKDRPSKTQTLKQMKEETKKLELEIDKALKNLFGKNKIDATKHVNKLAVMSRLCGDNDNEALTDILQALKDEISDKNRKEFNPYTGTKISKIGKSKT